MSQGMLGHWHWERLWECLNMINVHVLLSRCSLKGNVREGRSYIEDKSIESRIIYV